jgi:quinol monooxygenase YgiN
MAGVRLIINFSCDTVELAEAQIAQMAEHCRRSRQEPGCIQFDVFRSVLQPERYTVLEHWESEEALDTHRRANPTNPTPRPAGVSRAREIYEYRES